MPHPYIASQHNAAISTPTQTLLKAGYNHMQVGQFLADYDNEKRKK